MKGFHFQCQENLKKLVIIEVLNDSDLMWCKYDSMFKSLCTVVKN